MRGPHLGYNIHQNNIIRNREKLQKDAQRSTVKAKGRDLAYARPSSGLFKPQFKNKEKITYRTLIVLLEFQYLTYFRNTTHITALSPFCELMIACMISSIA